MTATVRIAQVAAAVVVVGGTAHGTSAVVTSGASVRIADVTASAGTSTANVRLADVAARSLQSPPSIRLADVGAFAVANTQTWDGTKWVTTYPAGVIVSTGTGTSNVTVRNGSPGTIAGTAAGRSTVRATIAITGALALTGGGTLSPSGAQSGPTDRSGVLSIAGGGSLTLLGAALQGPPGAGSVTVVPEPGNRPPRIRIELVGFLGTTATIVRIDRSGNRSPVRLGNPATLDAGTWLGYDYEAPYETPVRYEVTATRVVTSDPVVLDVRRSWLIHPGIPDLSQPIVIRSIGDRTRAASRGVFDVIGRANPPTRSDGVRRAPTFDLVVKTTTVDEYDAMEELLGDSETLLLQVGFDFTGRTDYRWVSIGDVTDTQPSRNYDDAKAFWTLPCTTTDAPVGLLQAQRTLADIAAEFGSLQEIFDSYEQLRDVITDNLIGS